MKYPIAGLLLLCVLLAGCQSNQGAREERGPDQKGIPEEFSEWQAESGLSHDEDSLERDLFYALLQEDIPAVKSLLEQGADPNKPVYGFAYRIVDGEKKDMASYPLFHVLHFSKGSIQEQLELLSILKRGGLDLNQVDENGFTAVGTVLSRQKEFATKKKLIEWLLQNGYDPNRRDITITVEGKTHTLSPILFRVINRDDFTVEQKRELIALLAACGADLDIKNERGATPLYVLTNVGDDHESVELVDALLDNGADPNVPGRHGVYNTSTEERKHVPQPPLHALLTNSLLGGEAKSRLIRLLLSSGADPNVRNYQEKPFFHALVSKTGLEDYLEVIRFALREGADPGLHTKYGWTVLESAFICRDSLAGRGIEFRDVLQVMISEGVDINIRNGEGRTLLFKAVENRNTSLAAWMIRKGATADIRDKQGNTPLHALFQSSKPISPELVKLLVDNGAELNAQRNDGNTPLLLAVRREENHEIVKLLVEMGAKINIANDDETTALGMARQLGHKKNAAFLQAQGGVPYISRYPVGNKTEACKAVLSADLQSIRTIPLEAFTRVNARMSNGVPGTPLHLAVDQGNIELIRALCRRGVDWNVDDRYERSPLQLAVKAGRKDIVRQLISAGANPNYEDRHGVTPLSLATVIRPGLAGAMLTWGVEPKNDTPGLSAIWTGNLDLFRSYTEYIEWIEGDLENAANLGREEIVAYLAETLEYDEASTETLIRKAGESREKFETFNAEAEKVRRLEIPRKRGGIADKRGTFTWIVESFSPWMEGLAEEKKLEDYPVGVYVPETYDGSRDYGLLVSMIHAKSANQFPRPGFREILDRYNIIWVGFDPYNGIFVPFEHNHECLALAVVYNMFSYFNIDRSRVYLAGFSWGGRLTGEIVPRNPHIFKGGIAIDGCFTTGQRLLPSLWYGQDEITMVFATGDFDFNRMETYHGYSLLQFLGYRHCHFIQQPLKGHAIISVENFEKAVRLLDSRGDTR